MFLGYQNGKIVLAKNTREEIENAPCMTFDEIVETPDEYVLWGNEYILKSAADEAEAKKEKEDRKSELLKQLESLDLKAIRALRAIQAGTGTDDDMKRLRDIELQAAQIREYLKD